MIIVALSVVSGGADELKLKFTDAVRKRFGDKIPIEACAVREDGKVRIIVKNISVDYITITKEPQKSMISYLSEGSNLACLADMDQLDHVILRPFKDEKSYNTARTVFEIPSYHGGDSTAEIKPFLGGYFPSLRDYVEFAIVAKLTLEIEPGKQPTAGQPATPPADKVPEKDQPSAPTSENSTRYQK